MNQPMSVVMERAVASSFTDAGAELLSSRDDIAALAVSFCTSSTLSEALLRQNNHVGIGNHSEVWSAEKVAIKLSTGETGRLAWQYGASVTPEDLIIQLEFLSLLKGYLNDRSDGNITAPDQYFALRNNSRDFLKVEEYMEGWVSIFGLANARSYSREEISSLNLVTKKRIVQGIADPKLRRGLSDLGIRGSEYLHDQNVLVPSDTDNPGLAPLCIIDQPRKGFMSRLITPSTWL
jgi:hypothetical protein